ncbi:MAG: class I SAM-dependent RNA methyltransferase [Treponema sp.]|jgi:putative N6-adenine-specific DNA methylase|nr:class I SAM-dependent RNA methyltransferase [Treponema sp.]
MTFTLVALCAVGAERVVSNELRKLGLKVLDSSFGKVRFLAAIKDMYTSLMALRAADRVLIEMARFPAEDFDQLFEGINAISWEDFIPRGMGLRIAKVRTNRSKLSAFTSIQSVAHKAAVERLCEKYAITSLPDQGNSAEVRVYLEKDEASVLLDLSGEPLFKRGYRIEGGAAPLRESTAAAIILLSNWKRKFPLYDPFCGSGTITIEAAMYAWDMAPGIGRRFALSQLNIHNKDTEDTVRAELIEKINFDRVIRIYGSDEDSRAISIAKSNVLRAHDIALGKNPGKGIRTESLAAFMPQFKIAKFTEAKAPEEEGFIITNPPYGVRLGDVSDSEKIYQEMGILQSHFHGWKLAVITDHPGFESHFGKPSTSVKNITNGAIRSFLYEYETI